ncbi:hypothetical protein JBKA6_1387 [Ichthyobacterium seriolicida]|uniref:Uncharacterized protein n=2 Tax=Ichthyobacterium seriolicida TaxID=242600 RepID=A0A1J1ED05_9FLAO|nr:hypothetical protein JBKA6_1387 [Ichthyobacterium seriolicida]
MFATFTIKLLFFSIVFFNQSCQNDIVTIENEQQQITLDNFEDLAKKTAVKFNNLALKNDCFLSDKQKQTEQEAKNIIQPLIDGSKELFSFYGVSESDFLEKLDSQDPRIAVLGLALLSAKRENNKVAMNFSELSVSNRRAQNAYNCALRALGIDAMIEIFITRKVTKLMAKEAIKKIAKKTLGWAGAALAAYEFGDCMGWY